VRPSSATSSGHCPYTSTTRSRAFSLGCAACATTSLLAASRSVRQTPRDAGRHERLRLAAARLAGEFEPRLELEERVVFPAIRSLLGPDAHARIRGEQRARRVRLALWLL